MFGSQSLCLLFTSNTLSDAGLRLLGDFLGCSFRAACGVFAAAGRLFRSEADLASFVPVPIAAVWQLESIPLGRPREPILDYPLSAQDRLFVLLVSRFEQVGGDLRQILRSRQEWT